MEVAAATGGVTDAGLRLRMQGCWSVVFTMNLIAFKAINTKRIGYS